MEIKTIFNRTYLTLFNQYNKIEPTQTAIFAVSGHGKGLFEEALVEAYHNAGYTIFVIADPKDEAEFSFAMYEPKELYHLNRLKADGMIPNKKKVILYHPFCFNIPKGYLPEINFFTIPIKSLEREELGILAETPFDSESIKVMQRARNNLGKNDGLYNFLHEIERLIEGSKSKRKRTYDPKNFYLKTGIGTVKSISEASGFVGPFLENYCLSKESCKYALDWKSILSDQENYHVFLSMWVTDKKIKEFLVLTLLEQIIRNRRYCKTPILIVIPEIRNLCKYNPQGYSFFLSLAITDALSTMRSQGRGISSVIDSQNWNDTDQRIIGSSNVTFFGKLNPQDMDRVCKARMYDKKNRELINELKNNEFVLANYENQNSFRNFFPRHRHKEPDYNWIETYKEYFSNKMKRYDYLIDEMKKELESEEDKIKKLIKLKEKQEEDEKIQEQLEAEQKSTRAKKLDTEIEKTKSKHKELEETKKKLIIDYLENPNISDKEKSERKVSTKFEIGRFVTHKIIIEYKLKKEAGEKEVNPSSEVLIN